MKKKEFTRKDGSTDFEYSLEEGDKVKSLWNNVNSKKFGNGPENHSIQVEYNGAQIYLKLTNGQAKLLKSIGDLEGKTITGTSYSNDYGTFVGVKVE